MSEAAHESVPVGATIPRVEFLGASEIAAIVGVSPYATALDVWAAKRGMEQVENAAMRAGKELERPVLERLYAPPRKLSLFYPGTIRHPSEPWIAATPDALAGPILPDGAPVKLSLDVQAKLVGYRQAHRWGDEDEGPDGIPAEVLCQVTWEMACAAMPCAHVPALFGTELRVYEVPYDGELFGSLAELGRDFWKRNVEGGEMPEVTASSRRILERHFGRERAGLLETTPEAERLARLYDDARAAVKVAEDKRDTLGNELRVLIGDTEGYEGLWGKVTWKSQKGRIEYKAAAEAFAPPGNEWKDDYRGDPSRVLRVNIKKEDSR